MAKAAKQPKVSPADQTPVVDPADVYARIDSTADLPPDPDASPDPDFSSPLEEEKPRKKKGSRAPAVVAKEEDPDAMDPFDAASEIVALTDGAFAMLCSVRGYTLIMTTVDGQTVPVLSLVAPSPEAKERLKKAMARVLKGAGASMSPGAGLALAAFGCYGAPIIGMEMAKAAQKKAAGA